MRSVLYLLLVWVEFSNDCAKKQSREQQSFHAKELDHIFELEKWLESIKMRF